MRTFVWPPLAIRRRRVRRGVGGKTVVRPQCRNTTQVRLYTMNFYYTLSVEKEQHALVQFRFSYQPRMFFLPLYLANGAKLDVAQQKGKKKENIRGWCRVEWAPTTVRWNNASGIRYWFQLEIFGMGSCAGVCATRVHHLRSFSELLCHFLCHISRILFCFVFANIAKKKDFRYNFLRSHQPQHFCFSLTACGSWRSFSLIKVFPILREARMDCGRNEALPIPKVLKYGVWSAIMSESGD